MFDLGPFGRRVFAVVFLTVQAGLILSADARPDQTFAFRMFNESSSLKFELFREVRDPPGERLVAVEDGLWFARGPDGSEHEFRWRDRVRQPVLWPGHTFRHATYGLDAQLFRLQAALDDVASHIPNDLETRRLIAVAQVQKNGRAAGVVRLSSARRAGAP